MEKGLKYTTRRVVEVIFELCCKDNQRELIQNQHITNKANKGSTTVVEGRDLDDYQKCNKSMQTTSSRHFHVTER